MTISGSDRIVCVDPGKLTGWAVLLIRGGDPHAESTAELDYEQTQDALNAELHAHPETQLVIERFTITPQTGKNGPGALFSIELIGVAKYLARAYGAPEPVFQTPQRAKQFADNARLRALGLWHVGGHGHALDALRHGALYLVDSGWRPQGLLG